MKRVFYRCNGKLFANSIAARKYVSYFGIISDDMIWDSIQKTKHICPCQYNQVRKEDQVLMYWAAFNKVFKEICTEVSEDDLTPEDKKQKIYTVDNCLER